MPNIGSLFKLLNYVPLILEITKQFRGRSVVCNEVDVDELRSDLADIKKANMQRVEEIEQENVRLKTRIRDLESTVGILNILVYSIGAFALTAFILALIALVRHG